MGWKFYCKEISTVLQIRTAGTSKKNYWFFKTKIRPDLGFFRLGNTTHLPDPFLVLITNLVLRERVFFTSFLICSPSGLSPRGPELLCRAISVFYISSFQVVHAWSMTQTLGNSAITPHHSLPCHEIWGLVWEQQSSSSTLFYSSISRDFKLHYLSILQNSNIMVWLRFHHCLPHNLR